MQLKRLAIVTDDLLRVKTAIWLHFQAHTECITEAETTNTHIRLFLNFAQISFITFWGFCGGFMTHMSSSLSTTTRRMTMMKIHQKTFFNSSQEIQERILDANVALSPACNVCSKEHQQNCGKFGKLIFPVSNIPHNFIQREKHERGATRLCTRFSIDNPHLPWKFHNFPFNWIKAAVLSLMKTFNIRNIASPCMLPRRARFLPLCARINHRHKNSENIRVRYQLQRWIFH